MVDVFLDTHEELNFLILGQYILFNSFVIIYRLSDSSNIFFDIAFYLKIKYL